VRMMLTHNTHFPCDLLGESPSAIATEEHFRTRSPQRSQSPQPIASEYRARGISPIRPRSALGVVSRPSHPNSATPIHGDTPPPLRRQTTPGSVSPLPSSPLPPASPPAVTLAEAPLSTPLASAFDRGMARWSRRPPWLSALADASARTSLLFIDAYFFPQLCRRRRHACPLCPSRAHRRIHNGLERRALGGGAGEWPPFDLLHSLSSLLSLFLPL